MRRRGSWWLLALALSASGCGGSEGRPEDPKPTLRLDDDGEIYVADALSRLARGRFDLVELMIHEQSLDHYPASEIEAMWSELVTALGEPDDEPRLLKVGTIPITRDDGSIGFFGEASFEMPRGTGKLRLEIACASHVDQAQACKPPFRIVQIELGRL